MIGTVKQMDNKNEPWTQMFCKESKRNGVNLICLSILFQNMKKESEKMEPATRHYDGNASVFTLLSGDINCH